MGLALFSFVSLGVICVHVSLGTWLDRAMQSKYIELVRAERL